MKRSGAKRTTRMIHLGPGAFFRAFNAPYTADAGGDWGIAAVSLRSSGIRDALAAQDYVYTAASLGTDGMSPKVVEVLNNVLVAPENPAAVIDAMADPAVEIVTMTITEKGYCHNPATGELRLDHADIQHDLGNPAAPRSALGFIVAALGKRRADGTAAFTVLSCDNLPDNGALTRRVILDFARALDAELADWIAEKVRFPATMVDRITPATTQSDINKLQALTGFQDPACVVHEPFRQWVIEDDFNTERPDWQLAGAQFVQDVAAFEAMKLRCLNGTHSALAYLGYLSGYQTVADVVAVPEFVKLLEKLWTEEIIPTVQQPEGEDVPAYCRALLVRFQNPAIQHRTWQIAMDGSQKLPQRILGTMADNLASGGPIEGLALVVAAWMKYAGGIDERGQAIDLRDPLADELRRANGPEDFLAMTAIFDPTLAANPRFRNAVMDAVEHLTNVGARQSVLDFVS